MIPLCVPWIRDTEWQLLRQCIDSEWVSYAGSFVDEFEVNLASYAESSAAAVTISGTSALHLALIVAGVSPGDEVLMPALSFVAPANAVRYCGAWPAFIDVSVKTWQMDLSRVHEFLVDGCRRDGSGKLRNRLTGRPVTALMPVHLLGGMVPPDELGRLCREFSLPLVEDAAEAFGSRWRGRGIGAPLEDEEGLVRMICTSFNGNKIMTTGGGGAVFSNQLDQLRRIRHLSTTAKTDAVEFNHDEIGFNYRLSNLAAALGIGQLRQMEHFVARKKEITRVYDEELLANPAILERCPDTPEVASNCWLYTIRVSGGSRPLLGELAARGIQSRPLWKPLSTLPFLKDSYVHSDSVSRGLVADCLSLPSSVGLSGEQQSLVIKAITEFL